MIGAFLLGLAAGSFLNVVILRLGRETLRGRSRCPHCGRILRWFELLPIVSFFIQRGRCRSCRKNISFQYPLVEFLCGTLFFLVAARFILWSPINISPKILMSLSGWWLWLILIIWLAYAAMLLVISVYDAKFYLIPDTLIVPLVILGFVGAAYQHLLWKLKPAFFPPNGLVFMGPEAFILGRSSGNIFVFLLGGLLAVLLIGGVWLLSRGRAMGFGDVKLAAFMGLALGWPDILEALFLAFTAGTLVAAPLLIFKIKNLKSLLPFGPFLAFGTLATMIMGDRLASIYFRIFPNLFL